jgi:hypothetical protein
MEPEHMRSLPRLALLSAALLLTCPAARADTIVTPTHVTPQASASVETSHVVPSQTGLGTSIHGAQITTGAASGYFMVLNAAADPGNGSVKPIKCVVVGANQTVGISADPDTMWDFPLGAVLVFSTTGCFTETQSSTAFFSWQ